MHPPKLSGPLDDYDHAPFFCELMREGLDIILDREAPVEDDSWKEGFRQIEGMWKDRTGLDEFYAENRKRRAERRKRMNALMSKWRA